MNSKSLRRLAADHGSLHTAGLPPNYLFPPSNASEPSSDLTALDILLAGPIGTPYEKGVWRLRLDIPTTYPTAPPTATFRTRLWHPNIDEASGAVCVETLKRDWSSTLKLRDVLVTISCLLIQPNPASALNEAAGKLASEDWDGYCRRARLMTEIHAAVPGVMAEEVREAQMRGEDKEKAEGKRVKGEVSDRGKVEAVIKKVHRGLVADDEENTRRRGETVEPQSDPESDWIAGPGKPAKALQPSRDNIFGIKGLEHNAQADTISQRIIPADSKVAKREQDAQGNDDSDPFITVPSKYKHSASFNLRIPQPPPAKPSDDVATATPELLKFSSQNPYSAIQPNNQVHPLVKEFSWSWEDAATLHDTGIIKDGPTKKEVRKRLAGKECEEQRTWEAKKFKRAGYDLAKYNRGDFGPKMGLHRL
ncbi:UBC-like protein [Pleomassaria siparia CBS 279.74]|uniref:UBC-like protein n=1 Tax=Pleomassaria siparia CBS 279.74 TaxID=1314801 RepID=A0A6G1K138_9PLEO|nr:UBC-like protein [Pleomassaria siparia CBS 279.74]